MGQRQRQGLRTPRCWLASKASESRRSARVQPELLPASQLCTSASTSAIAAHRAEHASAWLVSLDMHAMGARPPSALQSYHILLAPIRRHGQGPRLRFRRLPAEEPFLIYPAPQPSHAQQAGPKPPQISALRELMPAAHQGHRRGQKQHLASPLGTAPRH